MNLKSCRGCGVVLDHDVVEFPKDWEIGYDIDTAKASWSREQEKFVPYVNCPVCSAEILKGE